MVVPDYTETLRQWEDSTGISFFSVKQLEYSGFLTIDQSLPADGHIFLMSGIRTIYDYDKSERLTRLNSRIYPSAVDRIVFLQPYTLRVQKGQGTDEYLTSNPGAVKRGGTDCKG
jgi:hypothetical protein